MPLAYELTTDELNEYLRFRHVVRNRYAFELDFLRIQRLIERLAPCLERVERELLAFSEFLSEVANGVSLFGRAVLSAAQR